MVIGLNPYSNGSYFLTVNIVAQPADDAWGLNPYSNGSYFLTKIMLCNVISLES